MGWALFSSSWANLRGVTGAFWGTLLNIGQHDTLENGGFYSPWGFSRARSLSPARGGSREEWVPRGKCAANIGASTGAGGFLRERGMGAQMGHTVRCRTTY